MPQVLIIHDVADPAVWKDGFDAASGLRKEAGEISYQVLVDHASPNTIVHFSTWQSIDQAKAFFQSDEVAAIRRKLGVKEPEFIYLNEVESGTL